MATPITFPVYSETSGAPLPGALGDFTVQAWDAVTGTARPPPAVSEIGAGIYQLAPTDPDEAAGVAVLVSTNHDPPHWLLPVCLPTKENQFIGLLVVDPIDDALWTGAGPALTSWSGSVAPTPVQFGPGVWVIQPTALDIDEDAFGLISYAAGSAGVVIAVGVEHIVTPAPPPPPDAPGLPLPPPPPSITLGDIRIELDEWLRGDAMLVGNDLETDAGLETAMFLSLLLDRYDGEDEDPTRRRGWWADGLETDGDRIGSRLWRAEVAGKLTADVPDQLRAWTREALQWLLDDGVARQLDITPTLTQHGYTLAVDVYRPARNDPARFRFGSAWAAQEAR